jgi:hypothetical protein
MCSRPIYPGDSVPHVELESCVMFHLDAPGAMDFRQLITIAAAYDSRLHVMGFFPSNQIGRTFCHV